MKTLRLFLIVLAAVCVSQAGASDLDDVVAKHLEARGGLEKIQTVESVRIAGKMIQAGGAMEAPITFVWKSPDKMRIEFTFQGMTGIQAYDGEVGWMVMPFQGSTEPQPMSEEQLKGFEDQAHFHGPFVDSEEQGYVLEYLGAEEVEGTEAHKIKVTNKHGEESVVFLDAEYFLAIRSESKRMMRGTEIETETTQGDYKEVDGLMLAHSFDSKQKGAPQGQMIAFEKVELNVDVDDSIFAMPEKEEKPVATE